MGVDRFGAVAVQLRGMDAAAGGNADRQGNGERAAGAGPHAGGVRADLVEGRRQEAFELDLGDRPQAGHGQPDRGADDAGFGQRRVLHAFGSEALVQAVGDAEDTAVDADILSENDHAIVGLHFLDEGEVDGLYEGEVGHGPGV